MREIFLTFIGRRSEIAISESLNLLISLATLQVVEITASCVTTLGQVSVIGRLDRR